MEPRRPIDTSLIEEKNQALASDLERDYASLGERLARRNVDIEALTARVQALHVAIPSWGVGTGGTRFARFPSPGEPRNVLEKLDDCAVIEQLGRATPSVSLHFPWDKPRDVAELRQRAASLGMVFDAVNSNTFQDQPGQRSYKFGSLTHTDPAVRRQAVEHNLECIEIGKKLGSKALTVWIGDGGNFPGQQHFARAFDRYLESTRQIYAALPADWQHVSRAQALRAGALLHGHLRLGHELHRRHAARTAGQCLVDLGHHAPNVNIEMIVARLIQLGKLGGFHFNDSKYGDDDLDAGSINPFQLFLVFNELVDADSQGARVRARPTCSTSRTTSPIPSRA